jgi:HNH endonuclease
MTEKDSKSDVKRICQCGKCGREVTGFNYKLGLAHRFIRGHNLSGESNPLWKNYRIKEGSGYVLIKMPKHPRANNYGYVLEHIVVLEEKLGRPLRDKEVTNHINGKKDDNRPENLEVYRTSGEHLRMHFKDKKMKDMSTRKCIECKRGVEQVGRSKWFILGRDKFLCHPCHGTAKKYGRKP